MQYAEDERNEPLHLGRENEAEWARLRRAIILGEGFSLSLVSAQDVVVPAELIQRITHNFPDRKVHHLNIASSPTPGVAWLFDQVKQLPRDAIVLLSGLDDKRLEAGFWIRFNERRNIWQRVSPYAHIWFVNGWIRRQIREQAPDIYSIRSFDFLFTLSPSVEALPPEVTPDSFSPWLGTADGLLDEAQQFAEDKTPTGRLLYARTLAYAAQSLLAEDRLDEGEELIHQGLEIIQTAGLTEFKAVFLLWLGYLKQRLGQPDEAYAHYTDAILLCRKERNDLGLANTLNKLGDLEQQLGQLDQAHVHYTEAIQLYRRIGDDLGLASATRSLGDIKARFGKLEEAQKYYTDALILNRHAHDDIGAANTLRSLGDLNQQQGQLDDAQDRYEEAIRLFQQEHNILGLANVYRSLGDLEKRQEQFDRARTFYIKAKDQYVTKRENMGLAYTCTSLAQVSLALGDVNACKALLSEAKRAAEASHVPAVIEHVSAAQQDMTAESGSSSDTDSSTSSDDSEKKGNPDNGIQTPR